MVIENPTNSMVMEEARLKTFTNWPLSDNAICNAKKMAEAGFFCMDPVEYPDSAQCFLCKKQLDGWEEQDDPWVEHINHAKYCLFAQARKEESNMTLHNFLEFCYQFSLNKLENEYNEGLKKLNSEYEKGTAILMKAKKKKY